LSISLGVAVLEVISKMVDGAQTQTGSEPMDLTDEQWAVVEPLLPRPIKRADGKGRPRVDNHAILNGILWVMRTGAPWHDMPKPVSSVPNLPSALSRMGTLRHV